jgi:hypothetical protein
MWRFKMAETSINETTKRVCSVEGCGDKAKARGWCAKHYRRWKMHGEPLGGGAFRTGIETTCSIEGCSGATVGRGWCNKHYRRWLNNGDPLNVLKVHGKLVDWIKRHVDHKGNDCLTWPFGVSSSGSGSVMYKGVHGSASRVMTILAHGEPEGEALESAHSCGNGHLACVNPSHLRWATRSENQRDRLKHGTSSRGENHPKAKLTEHEVREIRAIGDLMTRVAVGKKYKISARTVTSILARDNWGWLE